MNHDELLAKIDNALPIFDANNPILWSAYKEYLNALRAVVELHKPTDNYAGNVCGYCFSLAYESTGLSMDYEDYTYPCPTIQAIGKELK